MKAEQPHDTSEVSSITTDGDHAEQPITGYPSTTGVLLKSARTSVVPSAPGWRRSSNEDANALAAAQARMDPHLKTQDWRAQVRNGSGMERVFALARRRTNVPVSSKKRPPISPASTTSLARPPTLDKHAPCGVGRPPVLRHQPLHTVCEVLRLRGEERREWCRWPVAHREKREVPRQSPQCVVDPGRGCQPDPNPAGTHLLKLLLLPFDTRELLQTPTHNPRKMSEWNR